MIKTKLLLGDCLDKLSTISNNSIDMVLCDLPYGTTQCSWDTKINLSELWAHYNRVVKLNGAIVLFAQTPFDKVLGCSNLKYLKYEWIWEKTAATGFLNAKKQPMKAHENILVFYRKQPIYNPQMLHGQSPTHSYTKKHDGSVYGKTKPISGGGSTTRYPRSVLVFPSDTQKLSLHPTQKPVALCEYLIRTYSNKHDLILDNCFGSGTTAVACLNTHRNFIGVEKDPFYFDAAKIRVRQTIISLRERAKINSRVLFTC